MKVILGMSGGVDSAVAAAILKRQGHDVTAVFMKNWDERDEFGMCTSAVDYDDARAAADAVGIPCYTVNFEKEYYERVFSYFLREYKAGRTPNPDVLCNSEIKFDAFLKYAMGTGADAIATGHYVRTDRDGGSVRLLKGSDPGKDQSYFLCMLSPRQLDRAIFPVGGMNKAQVRELAAREGLPVAGKKDSTGICFIGERKFREFLQGFIPACPGDIVDMAGRVVGRHEGSMYYTLGQRRGLGIGGKADGGDGRWYVVSKDTVKNLLVVSQGDETPLMSAGCTAVGMSFITRPQADAFDCCAKLRYRQSDQAVRVTLSGDTADIEFCQRQRAVTPGQYAVLYDGDVCLGGGIIDTVRF